MCYKWGVDSQKRRSLSIHAGIDPYSTINSEQRIHTSSPNFFAEAHNFLMSAMTFQSLSIGIVMDNSRSRTLKVPLAFRYCNYDLH